jgi:geranylgeranyl diphosphate synthase type II
MREYLDQGRKTVDDALEELMPREGSRPSDLVAAMRYSLFAGGKRIRPILVLAAAEAAGGNARDAMFAACAVEMVHTYSLIHDDLPAMDDDDYRRGVPTCHRKFGEATAILAGDALLTLAFDVLSDSGSDSNIDAKVRIMMIHELARAAGWTGMVGGQQVDVASEGTEPDLPTLQYIHTHKTGAMIRCSVLLGGFASNADDALINSLRTYGERLGLAFQVVDDILDITSTTEELGKDQGSDASRGKMTYPALFGLEEARERAAELIHEAKTALISVSNKDRLTGIADFVLKRRL